MALIKFNWFPCFVFETGINGCIDSTCIYRCRAAVFDNGYSFGEYYFTAVHSSGQYIQIFDNLLVV